MLFQITVESPFLKEPCNNNNKNKIQFLKKLKKINHMHAQDNQNIISCDKET